MEKVVEDFEDDDDDDPEWAEKKAAAAGPPYIQTYIHTYNIGTYNDHAVNEYEYEHEHEQRPTIALG